MHFVNLEILIAEFVQLCWSYNEQHYREAVTFSRSQAPRSAWQAISLQLPTHQHNYQIPPSEFPNLHLNHSQSFAGLASFSAFVNIASSTYLEHIIIHLSTRRNHALSVGQINGFFVQSFYQDKHMYAHAFLLSSSPETHVSAL